MAIRTLSMSSLRLSRRPMVCHARRGTADGVGAVEEVAVNYGLFIQNIVDFVIIAFSIFVALRFAMKLKKKEADPEPAPEPAPTKEEVLLTEIRDLLKQQDALKK